MWTCDVRYPIFRSIAFFFNKRVLILIWENIIRRNDNTDTRGALHLSQRLNFIPVVTGMADCVVIGDVIFDVLFQTKRRHTPISRRGTSYCSSAKIDFGGAGNVASALSLLGAKVLFIGKAGDDLWGKIYETDLVVHSVATNIFFAKRISTGLALVTSEKIVRGRSSCSEEPTLLF